MTADASDKALMAQIVGSHSVADNLDHAITEGEIIARDDGSWTVPAAKTEVNWLFDGPQTCAGDCPRMAFLFKGPYGRRQVPWGCRECFKVKLSLRTLRQLMAGYELAKEAEARFKCGSEIDSLINTDLYGIFFYCTGLNAARALSVRMREAVDRHPQLGPAISVKIKRGCTHYEMACGPSDRWDFAPDLPELEQALLSRYVPPPKPPKAAKTEHLRHWITQAHKIGDMSYLDLTGGQRLYPSVVTYE